jgi:transcriptional regulator with XRE-family HTH domain
MNSAIRTNTPFPDEVPRLLAVNGMSLRRLSGVVGVSPAHLSKVIRRVGYKTPSTALCVRVSRALGLPEDYFAEVRESIVRERLRADPDLRDRLYDQMVGR